MYFCLNANCSVMLEEHNSTLTHWGRVTYICVGSLIIIGSDNGLSLGWHQAIIWTNTELLSIRPLGTNQWNVYWNSKFPFKKVHLKMSSGKCRPFCLGLNVLKQETHINIISIILCNADIIMKCTWIFISNKVVEGFLLPTKKNSEYFVSLASIPPLFQEYHWSVL